MIYPEGRFVFQIQIGCPAHLDTRRTLIIDITQDNLARRAQTISVDFLQKKAPTNLAGAFTKN